jgi:predicted Zn-dependent protease
LKPRSHPVKPLDVSNIHRLRAAEGWLELGDSGEALRELESISPGEKNHPAVLELRFEILAKKGEWDVCRDIAKVITAMVPTSAAGWLHLAYATRRATGGSEQAAFDILQPMAKRFPEEPTIPYNLACYVCQLGRLAEAREWLKRAFAAAGNIKQLKSMAMDDRDLQPLWKEIPLIDP